MPSLHLTEYAAEATLLCLYMLSACTCTTLLHHPASPVSRHIRSPIARRFITAIAMGLTGIALIYSPLGQRSGAHMNPATTLTYFLLAKIKPLDATFYILAQFLGGLTGVLLARLLLRGASAHPAINHAPTQPGLRTRPRLWAFLAELLLPFGMMTMVLHCTNTASLAPYTGLFAGSLVAIYIALEAPVSGMSMNPARTLASAIPARSYRALWIYFTAPILGMLLAAFIFATTPTHHIYCAKLNHEGDAPCIFNCEINRLPGRHASHTN
jgi:aquaporin Z